MLILTQCCACCWGFGAYQNAPLPSWYVCRALIAARQQQQLAALAAGQPHALGQEALTPKPARAQELQHAAAAASAAQQRAAALVQPPLCVGDLRRLSQLVPAPVAGLAATILQDSPYAALGAAVRRSTQEEYLSAANLLAAARVSAGSGGGGSSPLRSLPPSRRCTAGEVYGGGGGSRGGGTDAASSAAAAAMAAAARAAGACAKQGAACTEGKAAGGRGGALALPVPYRRSSGEIAATEYKLLQDVCRLSTVGALPPLHPLGQTASRQGNTGDKAKGSSGGYALSSSGSSGGGGSRDGNSGGGLLAHREPQWRPRASTMRMQPLVMGSRGFDEGQWGGVCSSRWVVVPR